MKIETDEAKKIIEDNPDLRNILHKCFDFNYVSRQSAYIMAHDPFFTLKKNDEEE